MEILQKDRFLYYRQEKSNFLVMHNSAICFSGTRVNQTLSCFFFSLYDSGNMSFLLKYGSCKLQLKSKIEPCIEGA